jgi:Phage gp6-like head-tail connector protein
MYEVGNTVVLYARPRDLNDVVVTPTSVTVTAPDGSTSSPGITGPDTDGVFSASYPAVLDGLHRARWVGLGFAYTEAFSVWSAAAVSLDDAKAYLNITDTKSDDELRQFIASAEAAISNRCGPLVPTEVTRTVTAYGNQLVLPVIPALSLTSMTRTADSTTVDVGMFTLRPSGVATVTSGVAMYFSPGDYTVTWMAGRSTIPADLYRAVLEMLRNLWETQRGGSTSGGMPGAGFDQEVATRDAAFAWPWRVEQLVAPYIQLGIA